LSSCLFQSCRTFGIIAADVLLPDNFGLDRIVEGLKLSLDCRVIQTDPKEMLSVRRCYLFPVQGSILAMFAREDGRCLPDFPNAIDERENQHLDGRLPVEKGKACVTHCDRLSAHWSG
jgi:hypothetical protein